MSFPKKEKPEQYYRVDITRYPALSTEAELSLFSEYRRRRTAAKREKIVKQYLYWATELACRYCGPRMSKPEAISAANFGLMQAIEKFDPAEGKRFVTYSYFAIRREVLYALRDSYIVNPESGVWAAKYRYSCSARAPEDTLQFRKKRAKVFEQISSCAPILPGVVDEFPSGEDLIETAESASLLEALRATLPHLSKELRAVVELKYFNEGKPLTFVEIGTRLGHTPDHVRWLHSRALVALKKLLRPVKKEL